MTSKRKAITAVALVAVAVLCVCYYSVDPSSGPAPRCMLKLISGYDCPGCGTQRALHALLHGRVAEAWGYNPALFFAVPLAGMYAVVDILPAPVGRVLRSPVFILGIALAIAAWWVGRNL